MQAVGKEARTRTLDEVTEYLRGLQDACGQLEAVLAEVEALGMGMDAARRYCNDVLPQMQEVRLYADHLETRVADDLWPCPIIRRFCSASSGRAGATLAKASRPGLSPDGFRGGRAVRQG